MLFNINYIIIIGLSLSVTFLFYMISRQNDVIDKYEKKLENNLKNLESGNQRKTDFISIASHQLRSPLSSIIGHISMILEGDFGEVPENLETPLKRISKSSNSLGILINDFLNISKIEKNEMSYSMTDLNLNEVIKIVYHDFELAAKAKNLSFINRINDDNVIIRSDFNKTKQIISNIVENAIKYTPSGNVTLDLKITKNFATVIVADTGIGIKKDQQTEIFQKFVRDEDAVKIDVEGTGIGLYVASTMIRAIGGKIWVESKGAGRGSIFYLKFPLSKNR